jgi:formylmethanofuran dehydrogenase subunit E
MKKFVLALLLGLASVQCASLDNVPAAKTAAVDDGFIIQKISTGETYQVSLKPGVFPAPLAAAEARIRKARADDRAVSAAEIDALERLSEQLNRKMLTTPSSELVDVRPLPNYRFVAADLFGTRGDVINKDMPR